MPWRPTRSCTHVLTRHNLSAHRTSAQSHSTPLRPLHVATLPFQHPIQTPSYKSFLSLILPPLSHNLTQAALPLLLSPYRSHHSRPCAHSRHSLYLSLPLCHPTSSQPGDYPAFQPHHLSLCSLLGSTPYSPCPPSSHLHPYRRLPHHPRLPPT